MTNTNCNHLCGCKNRLLTNSSRERGKCANCVLGNCIGLFSPTHNLESRGFNCDPIAD